MFVEAEGTAAAGVPEPPGQTSVESLWGTLTLPTDIPQTLHKIPCVKYRSAGEN